LSHANGPCENCLNRAGRRQRLPVVGQRIVCRSAKT
jgi:hypothetical protein